MEPEIASSLSLLAMTTYIIDYLHLLSAQLD